MTERSRDVIIYEEESPVGKKLGIRTGVGAALGAFVGFLLGKEAIRSVAAYGVQTVPTSPEDGITMQRIELVAYTAAGSALGAFLGSLFEKRAPKRVKLVHED